MRCRNLFGDGQAYLRQTAARLAATARRRTAPASDLGALPPREARAVRSYSILLLVGTVVTLAVRALIGVPIIVN